MAIRRQLWIGAGLATAVLATAVGVRRCDPLVYEPPTDFSYAVHLRPRVFVMHEPLVPAPSTTLRITIVPDLDASATVTRAVALLRNDIGSAAAETPCTAATGGAFVCDIALGATEGERIYSGFVELTGGERVASRGQYRLTVVSSLPANDKVPVRVPVAPLNQLQDSYRLDTVLVRNDAPNYGESQFLADAHDGIFRGILADPTYRWRDVHLGFWVYGRGGMVSSYHSGLDTRCGQNPWPLDAALPAPLQTMEVIGLLHRRTTTSEGIEGTNTAPGSVTFRDCAGETKRTPHMGSFSASMGLAESPVILKHEFAHATFGVGDEYEEDDSTRRVAAATPSVLPPDECCCANSNGGVVTTPGGGGGAPGGGVGGGTPGGGGSPVQGKTCMRPGGTTQFFPGVTTGMPTCEGFAFPAVCAVGVDGGCPSLRGNCLKSSAWLGQSTPAGAQPRPNVFATQDECEAGRQSAADHPGIEDATASLGTCRQLCGPTMGVCPCEPAAEYWIVDIDPSVTTVRTDAMGRATSALEQHGGTCQWCVETTLCVRWQLALNESADTAWSKCAAPPKKATFVEALGLALVEWFNALIRWLQSVFGFG